MHNIFLIYSISSLKGGCGFYYVAVNSSGYGSSWISKLNLQESDFLDKYINALYFAFITMITIGFGDIVPVNKTEKVYVILMSFLASGIFAYAVNTVGSIFSQIETKEA